MWNCSAPPSLLLPFGDDYVKRESSSSQAGGGGLDRMLAGEYDLCHALTLPPSFQTLQAPMLFPVHGSHSYFGIEGSSIYNGEATPAYSHQFGCTQPTTATHSMKWMAAGETMTGDGSLLRASKRLKTTTAATAQGPHRGLRCNAKPRNQPVKAPCKRSQKLGDKVTALQQLVSPYGKTDTASVLHEAATCIKQLHEQIQILASSYTEISSPTSQQDTGEEEEQGATDLRRRGLCLAPLSPAVVQLVSSGAARGHRDMVDTEDCWRQLGTL
ncbi:hypothetical protein EJB05_07113 [Eragrostis curvula]|uniref:BHLH domain-containing protein n=1 Tax=Eragrostis curvula TaxID=38414 RepID=A0A5J9WGR7_9POAL|nr:hypothetical protein EJB05_07113 [Eragrostis curvula]